MVLQYQAELPGRTAGAMMWICGILAAGSLVVLAVTFAVAARRPSPSHAEPPPLDGAGGTHGGPAD